MLQISEKKFSISGWAHILAMAVLMLSFLSSVAQDPVHKIEINLSKKGSLISPDLFGHNLEHTRKGIWQGISAQMIANRKFAAVKANLPLKWEGMAYSGSVSVDTQEVYVGNHAVRLENTGEATVAITQQHEWLSFLKDDKYQFRIWLKSDSEQTIFLGIRDKYSARPWVIMKETRINGGDWELWSGEFTSPITLTNARIEIGNRGKGSTWIGAVSLMPADNFHGMRVDVIEKLKELKPGNLRWPGGCFAEYYKWKDGLLPVDKRPPLGPAQWVGLLPDTDDYDNHEIGIDEFIALCRELGCEPNITIPYGKSMPEEAASWVEYCNGDKESKWGGIRAERGYPEPHNVRRWYVGNEIWGISLVEDKDPERLAVVSADFMKAMKNADPDIRIIGCSPASNPQTRPVWLSPLMREAGDLMDLVQEGWYFPEWVGVHDVMNAPVNKILPLLRSMRYFTDSMSNVLSLKDKGMVIYEWNVSWGLSGTNLSSIFAAGMLNMFCREAESLDLAGASYFMPVNEGAIRVDPVSSSFDVDGEVFKMYASHQGNYLLKLSRKEMEKLNIDACASASISGESLIITFINQDLENVNSFNVTMLPSDKPVQAQLFSLIPLNFEINNKDFVKNIKTLEIDNNNVRVELPPGSISRLIIHLRNG